MDKKEQALRKMKEFSQTKALRFWEELSETEKEDFSDQILRTDFSCLLPENEADKAFEGKISPVPVRTVEEIEKNRDALKEKGLAAIREGKTAAVLLAGGMGTRLGSDGPKGVFDIGIHKPTYIFQRLIENLREVTDEAGVCPDLYIMTSEKNDRVTRDFLRDHEYFGYPKEHIFFFVQENAPAVGADGQILLEEKNRLATSPNGNGGWYPSLLGSEAGIHFKASGVEWLNVFAVDNVLQRILDPVFVGAVEESGVNTGAKVIKKNAPDEGVGVLCLKEGRPLVVEYYELTDEMKTKRGPDGELVYNYGVILNYLFRRSALDEATDRRIPFHRVEKKVSCVDENGKRTEPEKPNAFKYELLVLDLLWELSTCLGFEVVREREFAPIKNRTGKDSVESAQRLLQQNGIEV
ncbi:MAG: UTP--glucose-1-phosphate uridylyltransferase [Lachnospiraceae bacterium]|nr:UTP--glucose-1-phosphate uridylyltransferase [Lachnospiraceae bacterium]